MKLIHTLATKQKVSQLHAGGATAILCTLVLTVVLAIPAWSTRSRRVELRAAVESAEARLQRTRSQIEQTKRDDAALAAQLAAIEASPSSARTLDRRLLDISSIALELGLQIDSVEPGAVAKRADGDSITTISTAGRGRYANVVTFVARLRESAPDLNVETLQLNSTADRGCAFRMTLGWRNPPVAAARPAVLAGAAQ